MLGTPSYIMIPVPMDYSDMDQKHIYTVSLTDHYLLTTMMHAVADPG